MVTDGAGEMQNCGPSGRPGAKNNEAIYFSTIQGFYGLIPRKKVAGACARKWQLFSHEA
jgi:hypothetical protein